MAFLKLRYERAYLTGGIKTTLGRRDFVKKLNRVGMRAKLEGGVLHVVSGNDEWQFADWEQDGLEETGWLKFTTDGDIGALSRKLAGAGIRHKFDHSRPGDAKSDDVRCVTQYEHRWDDGKVPYIPGEMPNIETFDERF